MQKLQVRMILEILGRPKEHVQEAFSLLLGKIETEKGVVVLEKTVHEPALAKDSKDLFTSFSEITLEVDSPLTLFGLLFAYMPSHMEILSPQELYFTNSDFNDFANKLTQRLHEYDAITKKMVYEREMLLRKLQEVAPQLFKQAPAPVAPLVNSDSTPNPQEVVPKKPSKKSNKKKR